MRCSIPGQARRRAATLLLGLAAPGLTSCAGGSFGRAPSDAGPRDLRDLEARVGAVWPTVQRYRTLERVERLSAEGQWELAYPPLATDYVLPDRKYQRPAETTEQPLPEFVIVGPTVYQQVGDLWTVVDPSQIPADSPMSESLRQLRTAGLDGSPFRAPAQVEGKLTGGGSEMLHGRPCRWYYSTLTGPAGPMQLRVALEEGSDLPCGSDAEYQAPQGRIRQAVRYFDYNVPLEIHPPG